MAYSNKLSFIEKVFGPYQQSADGKNIAVKCPKCKHKSKKKLAIRMDDDRVHCWVCGLKGKLFTIIAIYNNEYAKEYAKLFAVKNVALNDVEVQNIDVKLPEDFRLVFNHAGSDDYEANRAFKYLKSRGLSQRDIAFYKFGVSSERAFRSYVIMPSFDENGNLNYYTCRSTDKNAWQKYINCDADKKSIIFNGINIDWSKPLTIVEGPFDLVKCDDNATCLLGSSLAEDSKLFSKIYQHSTNVILALDSDMVDKSWQVIAKLLASYDINVKIIDVGSYKDIGEMSRDQFVQAKSDAVKWTADNALLMKIKGIRA